MLEPLSVPFNKRGPDTDHHNIVGLSSQLEFLRPVSQYHNNKHAEMKEPVTAFIAAWQIKIYGEGRRFSRVFSRHLWKYRHELDKNMGKSNKNP